MNGWNKRQVENWWMFDKNTKTEREHEWSDISDFNVEEITKHWKALIYSVRSVNGSWLHLWIWRRFVIKSEGLCRWCIVKINLLDIKHRPSFINEHDVSETYSCLRHQVHHRFGLLHGHHFCYKKVSIVSYLLLMEGRGELSVRSKNDRSMTLTIHSPQIVVFVSNFSRGTNYWQLWIFKG
jgi:hypothetical protein